MLIALGVESNASRSSHRSRSAPASEIPFGSRRRQATACAVALLIFYLSNPYAVPAPSQRRAPRFRNHADPGARNRPGKIQSSLRTCPSIETTTCSDAHLRPTSSRASTRSATILRVTSAPQQAPAGYGRRSLGYADRTCRDRLVAATPASQAIVPATFPQGA